MAVVTTNLGVVTAYGDAVAAGYTGTKAEWQELMASYATVAEEAAQSATDAETAKNAAVTAKTGAETAKTDAIAAKTAAQTAQSAAEDAAQDAEDSAESIAASASQIAQNTSDISDLKEDLQDMPNIVEPQEDDADLYISDSNGNVLAEFSNGHIKTKNFDSSDSGTDPSIIKTTSDNFADLYITDSYGNVIAKFVNGHVVTKNFDSSDFSEVLRDVDALKNPLWTGKKWAAVGDSLTEVNARTTKHYHDYIAEKTGITVYNMGKSGSGYAKNGSGANFQTRIVDVPTDSDIVTIFGSGNDMSANLPLGNITDSTSETLCGAINITIDNLYTILPTANLGIITPSPWKNQTPEDTGCDMELYSNAIVEICKRRSIPCLDLYHCSNLRPNDATFRALAYSKDDGGGTHPDEMGHALIAPRIELFLKSLLLT